MSDGNPPGEKDNDTDEEDTSEHQQNNPSPVPAKSVQSLGSPHAAELAEQVSNDILTPTPSTIADLPSTDMQSLLTDENPNLEPLQNSDVFKWRGNAEEEPKPRADSFIADGNSPLSPSVIKDLPSTSTVVSLHLEQKELKPIENSEAFLYKKKSPTIKLVTPPELPPSPLPVVTVSSTCQVQRNTPPPQVPEKRKSRKVQTPNRPAQSAGQQMPHRVAVSPKNSSTSKFVFPEQESQQKAKPKTPNKIAPKLAAKPSASKLKTLKQKPAQQTKVVASPVVIKGKKPSSPVSPKVSMKGAGGKNNRPSSSPNTRASTLGGGKKTIKERAIKTTAQPKQTKTTAKTAPTNAKTPIKQKQNKHTKSPFTSYVFRPPPKE